MILQNLQLITLHSIWKSCMCTLYDLLGIKIKSDCKSSSLNQTLEHGKLYINFITGSVSSVIEIWIVGAWHESEHV